jgi:transcriptional regulator with XRE-family HTH domain
MNDTGDEQIMSALRRALKKLRTDRGVGIEDFYNDTGIHIGRIETAKSNITIITLTKICNYYNLTLKEFFNQYY